MGVPGDGGRTSRLFLPCDFAGAQTFQTEPLSKGHGFLFRDLSRVHKGHSWQEHSWLTEGFLEVSMETCPLAVMSTNICFG